LDTLSLKNYTTPENTMNLFVRRHTPVEAANSDHLPQKISSDFQNEVIYVDRYVKEASKELALSYKFRACNQYDKTSFTCLAQANVPS
jgi:uncharacterized protein YycO